MSITIKFDPPFQGMSELVFDDGAGTSTNGFVGGGLRLPGTPSRTELIAKALTTASDIVIDAEVRIKAAQTAKMMDLFKIVEERQRVQDAPQDKGVPLKAPVTPKKAPAKKRTLKKLAPVAEIRAWANRAGYDLGARGRIPALIWAAYHDAHKES